MNNEKNNEIMNEEELSNIITLTDADGKETEFEFFELIEYEGEEYVVLMPVRILTMTLLFSELNP